MTTDLHNCCPYCLSECDAVSSIDDDDRRPQPGDLSVCIRCGHVSIYTRTMSMRAITDAELRADSPLAQAAYAAHRAWLAVAIEQACDGCRMSFCIERQFTRCCDTCQRHVVPHRGCLLR